MSHHRRNTLVQLFNEQSGVCPYCMGEMTLERGEYNTATIEHIVPISKGGSNLRANFMAVCSHCNNERGNKPLGIHLIAIQRRHKTHETRYTTANTGLYLN